MLKNPWVIWFGLMWFFIIFITGYFINYYNKADKLIVKHTTKVDCIEEICVDSQLMIECISFESGYYLKYHIAESTIGEKDKTFILEKTRVCED